MGLHGGQNPQSVLETARVVVDDVIFNHTDQGLPTGKAPAVVPFPLEDAPEPLHGAVVDALANSGHALGHPGGGQLVMKDLGGIGTAPVAVEQGMGAGVGFQGPVQGTVYQSGIVGIPDGIGDDPPVTQIQDGAQIELAHDGTHIVMKLCHIGKPPLFVGMVCAKLAVQYIFRLIPRRGGGPSAALRRMFYCGPNPQAAADAQRPLVVDWRMVIPVQVVPDAAVPGHSQILCKVQ